MPKPIKQRKGSKDVNELAHHLVELSTREDDSIALPTRAQVSALMAQLGRKGGKIGGKRRLQTMTSGQRKRLARKAARAAMAGKEEKVDMSTSPTPSIPVATANEFIEQQLDERLRAVEQAFNAHALSMNCPLLDGVDDILRNSIETKHRHRQAGEKLVVVITTAGGFIETVQRMVDTLRRFYQLVEFVIPNYAYSAGTVLAMSGDAIHMDYYSRLGPIDPQVETQRGRRVSALGQLEKYNALIEKAQNGTITTAEVQLLIDGFDQAELYHYEQARDLSISLLEEWLVKYKFKNWKETETRKLTVTDEMKKERAVAIAKELNNTERWHSHGYGISMEVLQRDLKLLINDYGRDPTLSATIRGYHDLLADYMLRRASNGVIHIDGGYRSFI